MLLDTLPRVKRAIIVTHALENHFRNATLDIINRLSTTKSRRPRKNAQEFTRLEEEAVLLELHVLRVSKNPITTKEEERELARFRQNGIKLIIHDVKPASSLRLSLSLFDASTTILSEILDNMIPPGPSLDDHLCFVGYVFRPTSIIEDPFFTSFLATLTNKLSSDSCSSISARPLPLGVYLPPRPTSSDFDLDLPADQALSLQLLHLASETMQAQSPSPSPDEQKTANKLERRSLQLFSSPPSASKLHRRTLSSTPITSSSLKSLVLRPAPGPIQSVSMRITLPLSSTSKTLDLSLKVTECLPPIDSNDREQLALPTFIDKVELPPTPPPSPPLLRSKLKLSIPLPSSSPSSPSSPISPLFDSSLYTPIEKPRQYRNRIKPRSRQSSIDSTMTTKEGEMDEKWREIRRLLLLRRSKANERSGF